LTNANLIKALHIVRIAGNEAVHPGELDLRDDAETVGALFEIVNYIADATLGQDSLVDALWASLPDSKTDPVEKTLADDPE
jgi:hypothetical protein